MELLPSNSQDIRKYYCDSYVKLKEFGDQLFYITKVGNDAVFFNDKDRQEGVIYLHEQEPYTLLPSMPNKTMYQIGAFAYSMNRFPARQYSRGISTTNCRIFKLSPYGWEAVEVNFSTLNGYVDKPAFPTALDITNGHYASVALSNRFALSMSGGIFCDQLQIGTYNIDRVFTLNRLFIMEFTRIAKLSGIYEQITIKEKE